MVAAAIFWSSISESPSVGWGENGFCHALIVVFVAGRDRDWGNGIGVGRDATPVAFVDASEI